MRRKTATLLIAFYYVATIVCAYRTPWSPENEAVCKSLQRIRALPPIKLQAPATVVIMNWKRPENVQRIVAQMADFANVQEIIIAMCNADTAFEMEHPKVVTIDATDLQAELGVATRFKVCAEVVRTEVVVTVDDDILVSEQGFDNLIQAKLRTPGAIVSYFGRDFALTNPAYTPEEVKPGRHLIGLTKALVVDRRFCHAFFSASHLVAEVRNASSTIWNGEDIFMSLVSTQVTGELPVVLDYSDGNVQELGEGHSEGISTRADHLPHRTKFLRHAVQQLRYCEDVLPFGGGQA